MKKKISLLVCTLTAVLSFTGCAGSKSDLEYDEAMLEQVAEAIIGNFSQMGEADFQQFKDLSDYQLSYTMMQSGLPVEGEDFISMIDAWVSGEKECGEYIQHGDYEVEASAKDITVSTLAEYEDRKATIEFKFDEKSNLESMDISAKYTTGEILEKAGLNTVLGMGTVFVVLIFLAFLISLIKYIPMFVDKMTGKNKETAPEAKPVVVETAVAEEEELTDDLELVAVITAAIAAQEGTSTDGFVVRSIRRRPSNNWN